MKLSGTCLLIDDDLDDQEIFVSALAQVRADLECRCSPSGYQALEQLSLSSCALPDYIFLDLNMPKMNGKECLRELKKNDRLKYIPVVIYSTSSLREDIIETRKLGAVDFITKPFNMNELVNTLEEFFDRHEAVSESSKAIDQKH